MDKIHGNVVKAEDVVNYSRCGGYHGNRGSKNFPTLNAEETCYGMYMYFLDNMFNLRTRSNAELRDESLNGEINKVVGALEKYVMENCLDREKNRVVYNEKHFINAFSGENSPKQKLRKRAIDNAALMPYIIQYVMMQNGIYFDDTNIVLREFGYANIINGVSVTRKNKHILMANTRANIDQKRAYFEELGK